MFDLSTREIFISRHVIFYESIFPYKSQPSSHFSTSPISLPLDTTLSDYDFLFSPSSLLNSSSSTLPSQHVSLSSTAQTEPRHSNRTRKPPSYLLDYHCNLASAAPANTGPGILYPLSQVLSYDFLSSPYKHFVLSTSTIVEPRSYS